MMRSINERGVSEAVGAILLVSVAVIGVAIVAATVLSQPAPTEIPQVNIVAAANNTTLVLLHEGGDALMNGSYRIYVDDVERTDAFTSADGNGIWSIGENLTYSVTKKPEKVIVSFVDSAGGETVIAAPVYLNAAMNVDGDRGGAGEVRPPTPEDIYTVTFDLNGGTWMGGGPLEQLVWKNGNATPPYTGRPGHRFAGWVPEEGYLDVQADITVTAQWNNTDDDFTPGHGDGAIIITRPTEEVQIVSFAGTHMQVNTSINPDLCGGYKVDFVDFVMYSHVFPTTSKATMVRVHSDGSLSQGTGAGAQSNNGFSDGNSYFSVNLDIRETEGNVESGQRATLVALAYNGSSTGKYVLVGTDIRIFQRS